MEREIRYVPVAQAELRAEEAEGRRVLSGYAAVYNSLSEDLGGWRERIRPGAFRRALADKADVIFVPDHEWRATHLLGRTTAGTLRLSENDTGLRFAGDLPDTEVGRSLWTTVKRGDVSGMSFAFMLRSSSGETWTQENGLIIREVDDLELYEISAVVYPAYKAASVQASKRCLEEVQRIRKQVLPAILRRKIELEEQARD